jgi:hypothetical protein
VLEMGENEGGVGEIADSAGTGGGVLQHPLAAHEQGEAAFA